MIRTVLAGRVARCGLFAAVPVMLLALTACGGNGNEATPLAITFTASGKTGKFEAPKTVKGGLVEITFKNEDKKNNATAQLARLDGNHTPQQFFKTVNAQDAKIPNWIHGGGGSSVTQPGKSDTTTVNLPAGNYVVFNSEAEGQPAYVSLKVTSGDTGDLPSSTADITAKTVSKDKYAFDISGLKAGDNALKFANDSKDQLHEVQAFKVSDPNASLADVKKFLEQQGPPKKGQKPPIDFKSNVGTAVLDQKTDEVTHLTLQKGKYVFLCFLPDRDGGKPHFLEGLAKFADVK